MGSIAAATHTRAGNDYLTGITRAADVCDHPDADIFAGRVSNAKIGFSNLINWAVGLRPYKDTWLSGHQVWSTSTCMVSGGAGSVSVMPPYFGAQEKHPKLQALVSALSAGPIAPGDVVGGGDPLLIMTVCRTDGMLLKPDRPAYPPDALFLQHRGWLLDPADLCLLGRNLSRHGIERRAGRLQAGSWRG